MTAPADLGAACERCDREDCGYASASAANQARWLMFVYSGASDRGALYHSDPENKRADFAACDAMRECESAAARRLPIDRADAARWRAVEPLIEAVRAAAGSYPRGMAVDALLAATKKEQG